MGKKKKISVGKHGYKTTFGILGRRGEMRVMRRKSFYKFVKENLSAISERQAIMMIVLRIK